MNIFDVDKAFLLKQFSFDLENFFWELLNRPLKHSNTRVFLRLMCLRFRSGALLNWLISYLNLISRNSKWGPKFKKSLDLHKNWYWISAVR